MVEAVGEGAEVLAGVLCELEGFVGAVDHRLEVAQHRVDPSELRQIAGLRVPTTMYECAQPASITPVKQLRPSPRTPQPGSRFTRAQAVMASREKPARGRSLTRSGWHAVDRRQRTRSQAHQMSSAEVCDGSGTPLSVWLVMRSCRSQGSTLSPANFLDALAVPLRLTSHRRPHWEVLEEGLHCLKGTASTT
jgi:hypothetical protein